MEPWGIPTLTGYSCEDLNIQSQSKSSITKKRRYKAKYATWNSLRLIMFVKKTSMPNHVKSIYLLNLEQPKTSQKDPKQAERTQKYCKTTQNFEIWEIWNFLLAFVFTNSGPKCPNLDILGQKVSTF